MVKGGGELSVRDRLVQFAGECDQRAKGFLVFFAGVVLGITANVFMMNYAFVEAWFADEGVYRSVHKFCGFASLFTLLGLVACMIGGIAQSDDVHIGPRTRQVMLSLLVVTVTIASFLGVAQL